ncbi:hypothetical protein MYP_2878 [Sporocytophaga myxococcoides]|uniref:Prepilin type IV endopeptidase peptidase domain-containing protein n=1 Tax=Sporocytophaga myxococcoides TaxID=153721 RepID=A0A098LGQ6_9BACT|nr:hypothetical protein [Sporocytophaga myxococcoides]GAL85649.1 hypothetical protein MYP_2878 [Sporocytophaga myxococcoides]
MQQVLFVIIMVVVLSFIFFQDLKDRAVSWYFFPLLFLLAGLIRFQKSDLMSFLLDCGLNMLFVIVQLAMVWGYFSVKNGKFINITKNYLGIGDILFLCSITPLFSPVVFVMFYVVSLLVIVTGAIVIRLITITKNDSIPLAGLQSALLLPIIVVDIFYTSINELILTILS